MSESHRHFFDGSRDFLVVVNQSGGLARCNPAFSQMTGVEAGQPEADLFIELFHPDDRSAAVAATAKIQAGTPGQRSVVDGRIRTIDGPYRRLSWTLWSVEGSDLALYGVGRDRSGERESVLELRESEARYRDLVSVSSDLIQVSDPDGRLLHVNPAWLRTLGYRGVHVASLRFCDVVAAEDHSACEVLVRRLLAGQERGELDAELIGRDGRRIRVVGTLTARRVDGEPVALRGIFRDVTSQRETEGQLVEARRSADEARCRTTAFLGNMSHELRTPLNAIIGFTNVLMKNPRKSLNLQELDYLKRIAANGDSLLGLLNDVLELSACAIDRVAPSPVRLDELLESVRDELRPSAHESGVRLLVDVPPGIGELATNAETLRKVLVRLVQNGIRFTPSGEVRLVVVADESGQRPGRIEVIDTGDGVPEDSRENIFEPFWQGDSGIDRRHGGAGVGLTLARSRCLELGFGLEVESVLGVGSTFRIELLPNRTDVGENRHQRSADDEELSH